MGHDLSFPPLLLRKRPSRLFASRFLLGLSVCSALIFLSALMRVHPLRIEQLREYDEWSELVAMRQDPWMGGTRSRQPSYPPEVWAGGYGSFSDSDLVERTRSLLMEEELNALSGLCGRCLYHTLTNVVQGHSIGYWTFVATGDIPEMWIRDSSVQVGIYLRRSLKRPALRILIEGALRTQAFFIVQDSYANAFNSKWKRPDTLNKFERLLGRGGWVGTRNYELDSGAYFINFLYNYWSTSSKKRPAIGDSLLSESMIFEAVEIMIDTWITEQRHEDISPYRYSELKREGLGPKTAYTGMTWSGFRPSDDPNTYGYSIPSNVYAAGALLRVLDMNDAIWHDSDLEKKSKKLLEDIERGIERYGVIEIEPGVDVYAYEVDGLGNHLSDFDDANVPSLLSIPLLGWHRYNRTVYENTRIRLLDAKHNSFFFSGSEIRGIGSPHTGQHRVWPLALAVQALTTWNPEERAELLRMMLKSQCGNGLMHESVRVNNLMQCTREIFEWANAMLVVLVESALDVDCDLSAENYRMEQIKMRESEDQSQRPRNGGADLPSYYESLESLVAFDTPTKGAASSFHHLKPPKAKDQNHQLDLARDGVP